MRLDYNLLDIVFFGYLREIESRLPNRLIPSEIIQICQEFYQSPVQTFVSTHHRKISRTMQNRGIPIQALSFSHYLAKVDICRNEICKFNVRRMNMTESQFVRPWTYVPKISNIMANDKMDANTSYDAIVGIKGTRGLLPKWDKHVVIQLFESNALNDHQAECVELRSNEILKTHVPIQVCWTLATCKYVFDAFEFFHFT